MPENVLVGIRSTQIWYDKDPVLKEGQFAANPRNGDIRVGDGVRRWSELPNSGGSTGGGEGGAVDMASTNLEGSVDFGGSPFAYGPEEDFKLDEVLGAIYQTAGAALGAAQSAYPTEFIGVTDGPYELLANDIQKLYILYMYQETGSCVITATGAGEVKGNATIDPGYVALLYVTGDGGGVVVANPSPGSGVD